MAVLLDIDLGELPEEPESLYRAAHLANVACGGHAGDEASIARAVQLALRHGTRLGAHPSYPDREGFGRRALVLPPSEIAESVRAQCALFVRVASRATHVKMHGALYHAIDRDEALARVVLGACRDALGPVDVLGPPSGATRHVALALGMPFLREGFAERGLSHGSLISRGEPGALIEDPVAAAAQAERLASSGDFDVLCVHGDGAHAEEIARAVRAVLDR
jgi:UPF0271 protein